MSPQNRKPYVYLLSAVFFNLFAFGHWSTPLAAWLAPVFLVRYLRQTRGKRHYFLAWLAVGVSAYIAGRGLFPLPAPLDFVFVLVTGFVGMLPFLADRLLSRRLTGFAGTFVLPLAVVSLRFFDTLTSPYGSWGNEAYSQMSVAPLSQLAAVTGIWGILFLLYWFAGVVNWAWERRFDWSIVRPGLSAFTAVLVVAFAYGTASLLWPAPAAPAAQIGVVTPSTAQLLAVFPTDETMTQLISGTPLAAAEEDALRANLAGLNGDLLAATRQQAAAGADIVVWPEASAWVMAADEADFLAGAAAVAREEGIYLAVGLATFHAGPPHENKVVMLTPAGDIAFTYYKTNLVAFAEDGLFVRGDGTVPVLDTPFGRIAAVICHDADHHQFIQAAAAQDVDILLVPTGDWADIAQAHLDMVRMRAVEQGVTIVRATRSGISATIDPRGQVLASLDTSDAHLDGTLLDPAAPATTGTLLAATAVQTRTTLYSALGDALGWASLAGLVLLIGLALLQPATRPALDPQPVAA